MLGLGHAAPVRDDVGGPGEQRPPAATRRVRIQSCGTAGGQGDVGPPAPRERIEDTAWRRDSR